MRARDARASHLLVTQREVLFSEFPASPSAGNAVASRQRRAGVPGCADITHSNYLTSRHALPRFATRRAAATCVLQRDSRSRSCLDRAEQRNVLLLTTRFTVAPCWLVNQGPARASERSVTENSEERVQQRHTNTGLDSEALLVISHRIRTDAPMQLASGM